MKKSAVLAIRVTPDFKRLLRVAAELERRSGPSPLEVLLYEHRAHGIQSPALESPSRLFSEREGVR